MGFLDDLDIIEAKMMILSLQERYLALEAQRRLIEEDLEEAYGDLEVAKQAYRKLALRRGVN